MLIIVTDTDPAQRAMVLGRLQEGARQAQQPDLDFIECEPTTIETVDRGTIRALVGGAGVMPIIRELRARWSDLPLALVLPRSVYREHGAYLRLTAEVRPLPDDDLVQIVDFLASLSPRDEIDRLITRCHSIAVTHLLGGVGATRSCILLAAAALRAGKQAVLVDLDPITASLTEWAHIAAQTRVSLGGVLRSGEVPVDLSGIIGVVPTEYGDLRVLGQPATFVESCHYTAPVLPGAPPITATLRTLFQAIAQRSDVIIVDTGARWGGATFAALTLCRSTVVVSTDQLPVLDSTLTSLHRMLGDLESGIGIEPDHWKLAITTSNSSYGLDPHPLDPDCAVRIGKGSLFRGESAVALIPGTTSPGRWLSSGTDRIRDCDLYPVQRLLSSLTGISGEVTPKQKRASLLGRALRALSGR